MLKSVIVTRVRVLGVKMDPMTIAALIGAGTAIVGGAMKNDAASVAQGQAVDHSANQSAMQMHLAQHGVTMRARDIMNAYDQTGLHPLALMGVSAPSYTPTNYVGTANDAFGDAIQLGGQNVSRAVMATKGVDERDRAFMDASRSISLQKGHLELQLLASQIRRMNMVGPAMPNMDNPRFVDGQGNTVGVNTTGLIRDSFAVSPVGPKENVMLPEMGHLSTHRGGAIPVPGKDAKERIEDDFWAQTGFFVRNNLLPQFNVNMSPPYPSPRGFYWEYDMINGYRLKREAPWHTGHPSERR